MATSRGAALRGFVLGAALLAPLPPCRGDEVFLATGGRLDGKAFPEDGLVRIELETGSLVVPESAVLRIVPGPSPAERKAAARAERLGRLSARIAEAGLGDAAALYRVAQDARLEGYADEEVRYVLGFVLGADPDHAGAREDLGQVFHDDRWRPREEARWMEERSHAAAMRARGLVLVDGAWVTPEEADWEARDAEWEALAADLERRRKDAEDEAGSLAGKIADIQGEASGLRAELDAARAEADRLRAEVSRLECQVADLEGRAGHLDAELSSCRSALAAAPSCD